MAILDTLLTGSVMLIVWVSIVFMAIKLYYQFQRKRMIKKYNEKNDPGKKGTLRSTDSPDKKPEIKKLPTLSKKEREDIVKLINA